MDPWSKVDYSRHIREASMEMEGLPEVVPPSGRVPEQRLLAAPILKRQRRRYREEISKRTSILGISSAGAIYRQRGAARGSTREPGAPLVWPSPRTRHQGAWVPGGGPLAPPRCFWKVPTRRFFI